MHHGLIHPFGCGLEGLLTRQLGARTPSAEEVDSLLNLAATAAHASERTAAPLACWIAGRSDRPLEELQAAAERVD